METRHKICLGFPGVTFFWGAIRGAFASSVNHDPIVTPRTHAHNNFNWLLCDALNGFEAGKWTHWGMLHADVFPEPNWLDILLGEMDRLGAALISAVIPIKDSRGVCSCGIGNPDETWCPLTRFTIRQLAKMPDTFCAADIGYPGGMLLHNNGCFVADLRREEFWQTDDRGYLKAMYQFPMRVARDSETGKWGTDGESEDWYFSRMVWELGIQDTYVTKLVHLIHHDQGRDYPNYGEWGAYTEDKDCQRELVRMNGG